MAQRSKTMRKAASKAGAVTRAQTQSAAAAQGARLAAAYAEQQARIRAESQSVPTLNPNGDSGPQGQSANQPFGVTKSTPQKTTGSVAVRKASAQERVAQSLASADGYRPEAAVERGLQRVGKKFQIQRMPDGKIVHVYGNDVPANMRKIVLPASRRAAQPHSPAKAQPPVFHPG